MERMLKDDDVPQQEDKFHFSNGSVTIPCLDYVPGKDVKWLKWNYGKTESIDYLTKVTRPGKERKMKEKKYPKGKKVYVQFCCPDNDDDFSMEASFDPKDLDEYHPLAECTIGDLKEVVITKSVRKIKR